MKFIGRCSICKHFSQIGVAFKSSPKRPPRAQGLALQPAPTWQGEAQGGRDLQLPRFRVAMAHTSGLLQFRAAREHPRLRAAWRCSPPLSVCSCRWPGAGRSFSARAAAGGWDRGLGPGAGRSHPAYAAAVGQGLAAPAPPRGSAHGSHFFFAARS